MLPVFKTAYLYTLLLLTGIASAGAIEQSPADPRQYQALTLANGLEVLLISDAKAERAAAALDVRVGSINDPVHFLGLSHFLEHMLFLGTDRYPKSAEYDEFIRQHGGEHNAFTASEDTNYFFSIEPKALPDALERFSRFFIAPSLNPELVERERNAVDSEYRLKFKEDSRRVDQVLKATANPKHPYNRFAVGSLSTLKDNANGKLMAALKQHYQAYYHANNMKLVVLGKQPLAELHSLVERNFAAVPKHAAERTPIRTPLTQNQHEGRLIEIKSVGQARQLELNFSLNSLKPWQADRPELYLAQVLGHEAAGSLTSYLKQRGWATSLSSGLNLDLADSAQFSLQIELTPAGVSAYNEVTAACFAYINLLKQQQPEYFFTELQQIMQLEFRYQEQSQPADLVVQLASNLQEYPAEQVLSGPYKLRSFRADVVKSLLNQLTPEHLRLVLLHPNVSSSQQEPWYQTPYRVSPIAAADQQRWQQMTLAELFLPKANPYLPKRLELQPLTATATDQPHALITEPNLSLWHQQKTPFLLPKAEVKILLANPVSNQTARNGALSWLWVEYLVDRLNQEAYLAHLGGLNFQFTKVSNGLLISLSGFSEQQPALLQRISAELTRPIEDSAKLPLLREKLSRQWQNSLLVAPYQLAGRELYGLLNGPAWPVQSYLEQVNSLTASELEHYRQQVLAHTSLQMLSVGDLSEAQSRDMALALRKQLQPQNAQYQAQTDSLLPQGRRVLDLQAQHSDAALVWYLQSAKADLASQASALVLGQILQTPYYQELRTKQQLGYVVNASSFNLHELGGLSFIVQSPKTSADQLLAQSQTFVSQFGNQLGQLSAPELTNFKQAVISELRQKPLNQAELAEDLWSSLQLDRNFQRNELLAQQVEQLDLAQLQRAWQGYFGQNRRELLIRVAGQAANTRTLAPLPEQQAISDRIQFKQQLHKLEYPRQTSSN